MQLFDVPEWLQRRRVLESDAKELHLLFLNKNTSVIGDLSHDLLKKFYQEYPRSIFYKIIRILGFYGVVFSGNFCFYSGPSCINPRLLCIPMPEEHDKLADYINTQSLFLLQSCGVKTLGQLHGVPVQSIEKLLDCLISFGGFFEKIPGTITQGTSDFFQTDKFSGGMKLSTSEPSEVNLNVLQKPIDFIHLSARSTKCLREKGINTIGELVKTKPGELLDIKNFGKKSLREISNELSNELSKYNLAFEKIKNLCSNLVDQWVAELQDYSFHHQMLYLSMIS